VTPVAALQAALAVEHQVVYGYGLVGARMPRRVTEVTREECVERLDGHRLLRDEIAALVRSTGATPVAGAPAYTLPFPVAREPDAARLAIVLEDASAGVLWDVIETSAADSVARRTAVAGLVEAARWAARWRASTWTGGADPALPGQPVDSQPSTTPTSSPSSSTTPSGSTS
jgi:hypothetical protein